MTKHELEMIELTNMCMVEDKKNKKVLVQVRDKNDWDGISFPGGHVDLGESIVKSVIREVKEETGLDVENLTPCGIKDWYDFKKKMRYVVLFYKTESFSGKLIEQCNEGINKWMTIDEIKNSDLVASDFLEMLRIFVGETNYSEFFYSDNNNDDEEEEW
ncbi:MAG: 8-oxo-dGTP diphosphatase, partial [Bacilli bacterium]|nr:8-oxo-dGTP diphosphatase [Bacilli bacterium]